MRAMCCGFTESEPRYCIQHRNIANKKTVAVIMTKENM